MGKQTPRWEPTCKRFVAFLDIMGFKETVLKKKHEEVYKLLKLLHLPIAMIELTTQLAGTKVLSNVEVPGRTRIASFSDSIVFVSYDDSIKSSYEILADVKLIISYAVVSEIPLKGAIAYGEETADFINSIHFGQPLIDAHDLQNELQLYGVVLHHTMERYLEKNLQVIEVLKDQEIIIEYPVPMKSGNITHYLVNWIQRNEDIIPRIRDLYLGVSGKPRIYVDNTIEFAQYLSKKGKK